MGAQTGWVALFDWDETLHDGQTMPAWVDFLETYRAISTAGAQDFRAVFARYEASSKDADAYDLMVNEAIAVYATAVRGKRVELFDDLAWRFVAFDAWNIFPFAQELMERLQAKDVRPILVTGSALVVADAFAAHLGIECAHAMKLVVDRGRFTGDVERNTGLAPVKRGITQRYAGRVLLAGGDSNADAPMFEAARLALVVGNAVNENLAINHPNRFRIADPRALGQAELWAKIDTALRGRTAYRPQRTAGELR